MSRLALLLVLVGCDSEFKLVGQDAASGGEALSDTGAGEGSADLGSDDEGDERPLPVHEPELPLRSPADPRQLVPGAEDTGEGVTDEDPPAEDDCDHTSDRVYAIARDDGSLYLFDPETLSFTRLARLSCGTSATPASMAVARDGVAYVRYSDDAVYQVDLETFACAPTSYADRRGVFGSFGMGYATDSADTWRETLYVANDASLAAVDTDTWTLSPLGRVASQPELTGNADGELWAMLPLEHPAQLARLSPEDAHTLETIALPDFPSASDIDTFAFATWGGSFWLFVRSYGMGSSTDVYEVDSAGHMSTVLEDVGFDVVGAGVSTCAPS